MKTNELMIEDWILDGKNIAQIVMITCDGIIGTTFNESSNIELIEPVLLTPEILERNGFHKEWDEDIILMVCDTIIVEIGDKYKLYKDGKMYLHRVLSPLYYVHQLQHALRLCGIKKEIIL